MSAGKYETKSERLALAAEFKRLYRIQPPPHLPPNILDLAVAYRRQEAALCGLQPILLRKLLSVEAKASTSAEPHSNGRRMCEQVSLKSGTVILREWQGQTYTVQIIEGGIVFQGKTFRSLSQVARAITGQRWSGPRFFGLLRGNRRSNDGEHDEDFDLTDLAGSDSERKEL